jgi:hypothetical protein
LRDLKPKLEQLAWMRGAPQRGLSMLIRRNNARSSASIGGRPPEDRDFQRQAAKARAVPVDERLGRMMVST